MRKGVTNLKPNWTKILSVLALALSGASMLVDALAQKQEIEEAAEKAVEKYLENK